MEALTIDDVLCEEMQRDDLVETVLSIDSFVGKFIDATEVVSEASSKSIFND